MRYFVVSACVLVSFNLLLPAQAPGPKVSVTPLMNECRKGIIDGKVENRRRAIQGFYSLACEVGTTVASLRASLHDSDEEVRYYAAKGLANIGPSAGAAIPDLAKVMQHDKVGTIRIEATIAMGRMFWGGCNSDHAKIGIPALIRAMNDDETFVRRNACEAIRMIGPVAKDAGPGLLDLISKTKDASLRESACASISSVVSPETKALVPALLQAYRREPDDQWLVKGTILACLGKIGDKEDVVLPLLIEAIKDPKKKNYRGGAIAGAEFLGPRAKAAVPALVEALDTTIYSDDPGRARSIPHLVLDALASIGPDATAAVPALKKLAQTDGELQLRAAKILKSIQQGK